MRLFLVANWTELVDAATVVGSRSAPVIIVEFADFECPYCARFATSYQSNKMRFGDRIALAYLHLPIPSHRFALPAARAAECAAAQGHFGEFYSLVFSKQDSLGLKQWASFARDAGVTDSLAFNACNAKSESVPGVEVGLSLAKSLGVHATPTLVINGWKFPVPPSDSSLSELIAAALGGDVSLERKVREMKLDL